ncbi:MAG: M23 family metallopeptidase [Ardenticatenales bacterium]
MASIGNAAPVRASGRAAPTVLAILRPGTRRQALAAALAIMAWTFGALPVRAQSDNPAPDWDPPYCGVQPRITSIYDNDVPLYTSNGRTVLFNGHDVLPCGLLYDGHSGWDYARTDGAQSCGGGQRPGFTRDLVLAAAAGTVRRSRWYATAHDGAAAGYGLHVDVLNDDARFGHLSHLYGHLATVFVEEGATVAKGEAIGALGTTGNSTGPHLHFQGAKGDRGDVSQNTFDPFGWNAKFGAGYAYPGFPQPHRGDAWPMRVFPPGDAGAACPSACGEVIVEEDDPSAVLGCAAGTGPDRCPFWIRDGRGHRAGHFWTHPNGAAKDYWIRYDCPTCGAGTFEVDAFVPFGGGIADTHIARYEAAGRISIMDQHEEGDVWHPIGIFTFTGMPSVELSDRTDRYDYTAPADQEIAADAVRFRRIDCGGGFGAGTGGDDGTPIAARTPTPTPAAPTPAAPSTGTPTHGTPNVHDTPTALVARTPTPVAATGVPR